MNRICLVSICPSARPDDTLPLCGRHWYRVPALYKQRVWTAWAQGRGRGSRQLLVAQNDAVAAVERALGIPKPQVTTPPERTPVGII